MTSRDFVNSLEKNNNLEAEDAFKNAMKTAKQNGHDPKRLRLMKGTLANKGGTLWELIRETEKQILP